jgi:putative lipoprotein (rSAM/lipoprotein system)
MKLLNRFWCLLLGVLLPNSCSDNSVDPTPEYGVPQATVILDGVVVDNLGAPVKDIVIEMDHFGSTVSDSLGNWSMENVGFDACVVDTQIACGLVATDVDGIENGGPYPPTLVGLDLEKTKPGGGFDQGTYEQHDIRIVMEDVIVEYGPQCAKAARDRKKNDDLRPPRHKNN